MSQVNVTVENEVVNVLVTVSPEEAARAYALRAEAAEAAAAVSEFNAAGSAADALASEQAAELAEDNAAASASTATTKAGEAAASATAAASSASNAASQVGLATDQADRAQSEADRAQSEADTAETKAGEAAASATAANGFANMASEKAGEAEASASAALASQNSAASSASTATDQAAIATTQAGIATTQANNAEASASSASASAATITNQVDFTGAQAFDFLQRDGVNFKPVRENVPLQRVQPFHRSALFADSGGLGFIAWDNSLGKANENPRTITDSGSSYVNYVGSGGIRILNQKLSKLNSSDVVGVATGGVGSVSFKVFFRLQNNNRNNALIIGKDINNYFEYVIGLTNTTLTAVIAGTPTVVFITNTSALFSEGNILGNPSKASDRFIDIEFSLQQQSLTPPYTGLLARIVSANYPFLNRVFDLASYVSTFSQKADIAFCAFGTGHGSNNPVSSWSIKSISP